jgi:hypothetical protein
MNRTQQPVQARQIGRHGHEMNVIWHEAVRHDLYGMSQGILAKQLQVPQVILLAEENSLTMIAALGYVMGDSRKDESRMPRHA